MFNLKVSASCLMPTHYHLLVQTPDVNLFQKRLEEVVESINKGQT